MLIIIERTGLTLLSIVLVFVLLIFLGTSSAPFSLAPAAAVSSSLTLPDIKVPTLLLVTPQDRLAPFEAVEALAVANSNVTLETFEEGTSISISVPPQIGRLREVRFLEEVF